ncbi:MAG: LysR family transcriptional regulator [Burkholderiaceae bacterium]|nr:LysR family transcriptional regulator [Burkholderiaceae bacterium]
MRLRHIEVFNAILLTGSVSGAARLLNVTQPAVSRILKHAEIQLGFTLFERTKGRLTPTSEALTLAPHIDRLFVQLDEVQRLAGNLRSGRGGGALRILTVLALSYEVLPRAIKLFRQRHADVSISIEAQHSAQVVSSLVLQEADVGFVFSAASHPALNQEPVAEGRIVCVAPAGLLPDLLVSRGWVDLADLASLPVIGLDGRDPVGSNLAQAFRAAEVGLVHAITVQTYHAALALAHHGLGVALVDGCTALSADLTRMVVLALEPIVPVPIQALHPTQVPASLVMRSFVDCVKQVLAEAA